MKIGVDLDETMINNKLYRYEIRQWEIKKTVKKYLPILSHYGFELHVITARQDKEEVKDIISFIEQNLGIQFQSISHSNHCPKGKIASELGCKFMIDDYPEYLKDCLEYNVKPILLQNQKKKYERVYPDWIICENWKQICEFLLTQKEDIQNKSIDD